MIRSASRAQVPVSPCTHAVCAVGLPPPPCRQRVGMRGHLRVRSSNPLPPIPVPVPGPSSTTTSTAAASSTRAAYRRLATALGQSLRRHSRVGSHAHLRVRPLPCPVPSSTTTTNTAAASNTRAAHARHTRGSPWRRDNRADKHACVHMSACRAPLPCPDPIHHHRCGRV